MKALFIIAVLFIGSLSSSIGQDVPGVISFSGNDSPVLQSWKVTQDCEGIIYVANTDGILIHNGFSWKKLSLPANRIPRAIFTGVDCRVYTAGFETAGYIDRSDPAHPVYQSLADSLLEGTNQEIWNIFGNSENLFFQSFSEAYRFNFLDQKIERTAISSNVMLGNAVEERIFLPKITQGLFEYEDKTDQFNPVPGSEQLPSESKIAAVNKINKTDTLILATQYNGVFYLVDGDISLLQNPLIEKLKREQINKMIALSNGDYAIGTILNGVYITSDLKTIKYHFNRSTGLSNNTVLSLLEDQNGDLWVGLDKGINLLKISDPALYHHDIQDLLGTIFVSKIFQDKLYLGTNKGLFVKGENGQFELIEQSQGQVWSLLEVGGQLLCGHNSGTYLVKDGEFDKVSSITGGWSMDVINDSLVIQSSYIGLLLLEYSNEKWQVKKRVDEGGILIERFALAGQTLVGYHAHYGICILQLSDDYTSVENQRIINSVHGRTVNASIILSKAANRILLFNEGEIFQFIEGEFKRLNSIDEDSSSKRSLEVANQFRVYQHVLDESQEDRSVNFRVLPNKLPGEQYIVNSSNGYISFPNGYNHHQRTLNAIYVDAIYSNQKLLKFDHSQTVDLLSKQNDLNIHLGNRSFQGTGLLTYQLKGWDDLWYELPGDGQLNFINLDDGHYELLIRRGAQEKTVLTFELPPHWYESWVGAVLYAILAGLAIWTTVLWYRRKLRLETNRLEAEKRIELEAIKMRSNNEKLKRELIYKSKMLANSAMTIIQKNNMLNDLKGLIKKEDPNHWETGRSKQKMLNIIQRSINSDEDWEIFERNFEEVHDDFLKNLQTNYPNITSGEIRLAAYIRMSLSSKQIAPLMNISVRSVENKRYRLRKKMGLTGTQSLADLLMRL